MKSFVNCNDAWMRNILQNAKFVVDSGKCKNRVDLFLSDDLDCHLRGFLLCILTVYSGAKLRLFSDTIRQLLQIGTTPRPTSKDNGKLAFADNSNEIKLSNSVVSLL